VFEFVRAGAATLPHVAELVVAAELAELVVALLVEPAEAAEFLVAALLGDQPPVGEFVVVIVAGAVLVVAQDADHLPDAHPDEPAGQHHQQGRSDRPVGGDCPDRPHDDATHYQVPATLRPSIYRRRYYI